jgi:hypothetical protein
VTGAGVAAEYPEDGKNSQPKRDAESTYARDNEEQRCIIESDRVHRA